LFVTTPLGIKHGWLTWLANAAKSLRRWWNEAPATELSWVYSAVVKSSVAATVYRNF